MRADMEINYRATNGVRDIIASIGRTEDIRFSPSNRRLVIAAAVRNKLAVLDIDIAASGAAREVVLTGAFEISSPCLKYPHGLDFIDEETLVVGSRYGGIGIFKLPSNGFAARQCDLSPVQTWPAGKDFLLRTPGSISVVRKDDASSDLLVCNNYRHNVTRHRVNHGDNYSTTGGEVLLRRWLDIPDGISVCGNGQWIAVSNHNTHGVLVYENSSSLNQSADPDGILRSVYYPHGLRFSPDGRFMFVADAGAPYVHIYASDGQGWRGVRNPVASFKVMDDPVFLRGRYNPHEGGPKGIDIDRGLNVLVATSEHQPLAFFDLQAILETTSPAARPLEMDYELNILEQSRRLRVRTRKAEARAARATAGLGFAIDRRLRRIGKRLRGLLGPLGD